MTYRVSRLSCSPIKVVGLAASRSFEHHPEIGGTTGGGNVPDKCIGTSLDEA